MTDTIDEANDRAEEFLNEALRKQQLLRRAAKENDECEECGIALQSFRRPYGRCKPCQEDVEEQERLRKLRGE